MRLVTSLRALVFTILPLCGGCAVPHFDVPTDPAGQPTVASIVARIECEIWNMVRDDRPDDPRTFHRLFLLNNDMDLEGLLSLEVNDTGGLAPSLSFIKPLPVMQSVTWGVGATLSESRDHKFSEYLYFNARDVYLDGKANPTHYECPVVDTNLSGALGIADFVSMASSSENLYETQKLSDKGAFGGTIQFLVKKDLTSAGPLWTLTKFKGPGPLLSLSEDNTDNLTITFARGAQAGHRMATRPSGKTMRNPAAHQLLQDILTGSISSQLSVISSNLH